MHFSNVITKQYTIVFNLKKTKKTPKKTWSGTRHIFSTTRDVASISSDFGKESRIWSVVERCSKFDQAAQLFICPRLCSYLTKYILYLPVFFSYRNIHLWVFFKCFFPSFPLGCSSSWKYSWNWWGGGGWGWNSGSDTVLTSMADTDRAVQILQPSRIPEEWTPPCLSCSPSSSSPCSIPPFIFLQGQGETRRRAQQYRLAATHCHKQERRRKRKCHEWTRTTSRENRFPPKLNLISNLLTLEM